MKEEEYFEQAMANLRGMSRTANGIIDTSASVTKKDALSVSDGDRAKALAVRNFENAFRMAWDNRYRVFENADELRLWIEDLAREINRDILKDGVLYRTGADSTEFNYVPVADIEHSVAWFFGYLYDILRREPYDAEEAAAAAEYYINLRIHPFADGCSKCSMAVSAWLLMRGDHALPHFPDRDAYYSFCSQLKCFPVGSESDRRQFARFLSYCKGLFV